MRMTPESYQAYKQRQMIGEPNVTILDHMNKAVAYQVKPNGWMPPLEVYREYADADVKRQCAVGTDTAQPDSGGDCPSGNEKDRVCDWESNSLWSRLNARVRKAFANAYSKRTNSSVCRTEGIRHRRGWEAVYRD